MRYVSYNEFRETKLNEQRTINEAVKPSVDFGFGVKELDKLRVGDFVWQEMERHNPQLGVYYVLTKAKVAKIAGKKIWIQTYGSMSDKAYDKMSGEQLKPSDSAYGSAYYSLMTHQEALITIKSNPERYRDSSKVLTLTQDDITAFVNESVDLNESASDVNYKEDQFALVSFGGSIGSKSSFPVYAAGKMGDVIKTSNDKEDLKAAAKRMRKSLSAGDKSYYGMGYTVIELTNAKRKEIEYLKDFRKKSEDDKIEESEDVTEGRKFVMAARKAKDEDEKEFEFNGKKYPVTIKESRLFEAASDFKQYKAELEKNMKVKLIEIYSSIKDDNEDEDFGHYITYEIIDNKNKIESNKETLVLNIYEDGTAQFFHDSTPYAISTNSTIEIEHMIRTLMPYPKPIKDFKRSDLDNVTKTISEQ